MTALRDQMRPVELGGTTGSVASTPMLLGQGLRYGVRATVHHGRPVTMGPATCQGCGSLVWWSGALWSERDGTWHRCGGRA